jgi:CheY-like chemotaxis protein
MSKVATILIVDDQRDFRESLAMIFTHSGYRVDLACNGREALDYLHAHAPPGLILLDLRMPDMCGVSFRRSQLLEPELSNIPVIITSGEPELLEDAQIGDVTLWTKTSEPRNLIRLVEALCQEVPDAATMPPEATNSLVNTSAR